MRVKIEFKEKFNTLDSLQHAFERSIYEIKQMDRPVQGDYAITINDMWGAYVGTIFIQGDA